MGPPWRSDTILTSVNFPEASNQSSSFRTTGSKLSSKRVTSESKFIYGPTSSLRGTHESAGSVQTYCWTQLPRRLLGGFCPRLYSDLPSVVCCTLDRHFPLRAGDRHNERKNIQTKPPRCRLQQTELPVAADAEEPRQLPAENRARDMKPRSKSIGNKGRRYPRHLKPIKYPQMLRLFRYLDEMESGENTIPVEAYKRAQQRVEHGISLFRSEERLKRDNNACKSAADGEEQMESLCPRFHIFAVDGSAFLSLFTVSRFLYRRCSTIARSRR